MNKIVCLIFVLLFATGVYAYTPTVTVTPTITQTYTFTPTATPSVTPINTPMTIWYYTDKTIDSGSFAMDTSIGQKDVDLSSIAPWIANGFVVRLSSDMLPPDGKLTAYKHAVSFTAAIEDFFLGTPIDCSINTILVRYDVFRIPPP